MKLQFPIYIILALLVLACDRQELPIPSHVAGDVKTSSVDLGTDYRWQAFFDLESGLMVSQNLKTDWDLGFETSASGYHIFLNSSKAMYAWPTGDSSMANVTDTTGFATNKRWDAPTGNLDSTAFGDWRIQPQVYLIDRGYDAQGHHQGFRKMQVLGADYNAYQIRFSELNGTGDTHFTIPKDSAYNLSFLSFANGGKSITIEPPKANWDLCFTQYLEVLPEPYLVTGVLLNRYHTSAAMDSSQTFQSIQYAFAADLEKSTAINTIGYAWKYYHFTNATYEVLPQMNYLIQDQQGILYKLHFTDFYNDQGQKGTPKWEYQRL